MNISHPLQNIIQIIIATLVAFIMSILGSCSPLQAQKYTQVIERTARFAEAANPDNTLRIYNIRGKVTVEGYNGQEIQVRAEQTIEGRKAEITRAREELKFVVERDGPVIQIYLDAPFITIKKNKNGISYNIQDWDDEYEFTHDITVRVPRQVYVYASTITDGAVTVNDMRKGISANNVNGSIELKNIAGATRAHTVNGKIAVHYAESPSQDSDYQTVNGTIEINAPQNLSADVRFKSLHGDLYTDFENIQRLQARVDSDRDTRGSSTRYRVDKFAPIRIGKGGPTMKFEVLNGNVYIKQIKS